MFYYVIAIWSNGNDIMVDVVCSSNICIDNITGIDMPSSVCCV